VDEQRWWVEAQALGIPDAVGRSGLSDRQQRRVSMAIVREAHAHGLDPLLLVAVIQAESSFNAYAVSRVGAMGLMQVMPDTGSWLATRMGTKLGRKDNLFDAETNVQLGTAYLAELIARFGSVENALVAYNAGPALARRIISQPDARKRFVAGYPRKVIGDYKKLRTRHEEAWVRKQSARLEATASAPGRLLPMP
jgi:soluble lytic murein transglycosylase